MYGERDDPYAVLTHLGSRLEATMVLEKVLPTIVETVAQALKLPYVAIALLPERAIVYRPTVRRAIALAHKRRTSCPPPARRRLTLLRVPLVYQAETIGYLLLDCSRR